MPVLPPTPNLKGALLADQVGELNTFNRSVHGALTAPFGVVPGGEESVEPREGDAFLEPLATDSSKACLVVYFQGKYRRFVED